MPTNNPDRKTESSVAKKNRCTPADPNSQNSQRKALRLKKLFKIEPYVKGPKVSDLNINVDGTPVTVTWKSNVPSSSVYYHSTVSNESWFSEISCNDDSESVCDRFSCSYLGSCCCDSGSESEE